MTLEHARTFLESIHPLLPAALLVAVIWLSQWLVRRFAPNMWERIADLPFPAGIDVRPVVTLARKVWQALPSIALGAFLAALSGDGGATELVFGAVLGALAPVWHELLKAVPFVPYQGGKPPVTIPPALKQNFDELTPAEPSIQRRHQTDPSTVKRNEQG